MFKLGHNVFTPNIAVLDLKKYTANGNSICVGVTSIDQKWFVLTLSYLC